MNNKKSDKDFEIRELSSYFERKIDFTFSFFVVIVSYAIFESLEVIKRTLRLNI